MFRVNDHCLERFKKNTAVSTVYSKDENYQEEYNKLFTEDTLNKYNPGSLPRHALPLKVGCSLMLLRNCNLAQGLANGTRLRLLEISKSKQVIRVEVLTGPRANPNYTLEQRSFNLYRRFACTLSNDKHMRMIRHQFPVRLTYGMSINKSQGKVFSRPGFNLFVLRTNFETSGTIFTGTSLLSWTTLRGYVKSVQTSEYNCVHR